MSDIKTETQIEKDIFRIVKASEIAQIINGDVYRKGMRPLDAQTEDAVVAFHSGLDGQFQTGIVHLNVYVPKIDNDSAVKVKDIARVEELEAAIVRLFDEGVSDPYYELEVRETPASDDLDDIGQTRINTRIHYRRTTF